MKRLLLPVLRAAARSARMRRLARALIARVPFLRTRAYALLARGALQARKSWDDIPVTPGDLSPRAARALAALEQASAREHR